MTFLHNVRVFLAALVRHWLSKIFALLALGSTAATYVSSFFPRFHFPWWIAVLFGVTALIWGSFDLFLAQAKEIERIRTEWAQRENAIEQEKAACQERLARFENAAVANRQRLLADLISELEHNLLTAQNPTSGLPGNRVYIQPAVQWWRDHRNELDFLNEDTRAALTAIYRQIERWYGIVAGGRARPDIGNPEINDIIRTVRAELRDVLLRLRAVGQPA